MLGSVVGIQAGQACGKLLFGLVPPVGVVALRLGFAALVLCALWRPRRWPERRDLPLILGLGTAIAGMHAIYPALERLPVGAAVTIQFLGPLTVALAGSRRLRDVAWAGLAGLGVFLFYGPGTTALPTAGVAFALVSGACWAAYVLLVKRIGARASDPSLLALAVAWAALLCVPFGVAGADLARPGVLLAGFGVAVLSAVLPWSLDLAALRRMPARVFGVLASLEPALGGLAGVVILGEHLAPAQWLAIGSVVAASIGVTLPRP